MSRVVVFSICGRRREAVRIVGDLVNRRLAACVNMLPVSSFFRWHGKVQNESEWLLLIKARLGVFAELKGRISKLNRYEVAEIVLLKVNDGLLSYVKWMGSEEQVIRRGNMWHSRKNRGMLNSSTKLCAASKTGKIR
jgi:periplasmic divalent cation tolerance protein